MRDVIYEGRPLPGAPPGDTADPYRQEAVADIGLAIVPSRPDVAIIIMEKTIVDGTMETTTSDHNKQEWAFSAPDYLQPEIAVPTLSLEHT